MPKQDLELLNQRKVGIVGCGHLGLAIAQCLVARGLARENLILSHKGNPLTEQKLKAEGLSSCLDENERVFSEAGIVLITVRPQNVLELKGTSVGRKSLLVSCMAGIPVKMLNQIFDHEVYRMMLSGPDTLLSGKGAAAFYPQHELLKLLIGMLNLKHIQIRTESDMDVFTAGVCMPAAALKVDNPNECARTIEKIGAEYPLLTELYEWAVKALPAFRNRMEKEVYIKRMITKGGITEAIINSLQEGELLDASLRKGIARTKEISAEIQKTIANGKIR